MKPILNFQDVNPQFARYQFDFGTASNEIKTLINRAFLVSTAIHLNNETELDSNQIMYISFDKIYANSYVEKRFKVLRNSISSAKSFTSVLYNSTIKLSDLTAWEIYQSNKLIMACNIVTGVITIDKELIDVESRLTENKVIYTVENISTLHEIKLPSKIGLDKIIDILTKACTKIKLAKNIYPIGQISSSGGQLINLATSMLSEEMFDNLQGVFLDSNSNKYELFAVYEFYFDTNLINTTNNSITEHFLSVKIIDNFEQCFFMNDNEVILCSVIDNENHYQTRYYINKKYFIES